MMVPVVAICGLVSDEESWRGMPVDRIVVARESSIGAMAAAVLASTTGRFAVCGHSMGGYVALAVAATGGARVAGLALIGTSAAPDEPEQSARREALIAAARADFAAVARQLAGLIVGPAHRSDAAMLDALAAMLLRCGPELFETQQRAIIARPDQRPSLGRMPEGTLIISGDEDRIVAPARSDEMAEAIPGAQLVRLPGCGHFPQWEAPEATRRALLDWRARLPSV